MMEQLAEGAPAVGTDQLNLLLSRLRQTRQEIGKAVIGQADVVDELLIALIGGGHVLLEGVPGLGKTMLVRTLAEAVNLKFARVQFTPDLMPADIVGTNMIAEDENGRKSF